MTDREIMQQALEALETADESAFWVKQESVVKALRDRLAQPEQEPVACQYAKDVAMPEYRCAGKCQYAQPEQEPVAVVSGYYGGQCVILPIDPARIFNSNTALYTAPPQRKPLTDEEIDRLWSQSLADTEGETYLPLREFARAIEAKLKEKNNG